MSQLTVDFQIPVLYGILKVNTLEVKSRNYYSTYVFQCREEERRNQSGTMSLGLKYAYSVHWHPSPGHCLYLCADHIVWRKNAWHHIATYRNNHPKDLGVTVNVKSNTTGHIIAEITHTCRFLYCNPSKEIFHITEAEMVRLDPEYSRTHTIEFIVEVKEVGVRLSADCEWNSYPKSWTSLSKDFAKILDDPRTADIELHCGDLTIPAHGHILSARSEVFERMLQTDMREKRTGSIDIPDIEPQVIKEFVRYLYTASLPKMTVQKASKLYEAGDKYNVPSLVAECRNFLGRSLNEENVCQVLVLADKRSDLDLKKRSLHILCNSHLLNTRLKKLSKEGPKRELEAMKFAHDYLFHQANVYRRHLRSADIEAGASSEKK